MISTVGGIASSSSSNVCFGDNSGVVSVSGKIGDIVRWEKTIDDWNTITSIPNTINAQDYEDLTKTTKYRAIIKSGACLEAISNETTVIVDDISVAGTVSTNLSNVCSGNNSGVVKISNQIGNVVRWETTTNDWNTINVISNSSNTHNYNNLSQATSYRAVVQSGACLEAITNQLTVNIDAVSEGGILSKDTSVCYGDNSGNLFLKNQIGNVVRWEFSTDDFMNSTSIERNRSMGYWSFS